MLQQTILFVSKCFEYNFFQTRLIICQQKKGLWNVNNGDCIRIFRFPSPFIKVQFNPRDNHAFLVCLLKYPSILVNQDGTYHELPLDDPNEPNVVSSFDKRGEHIFCGNGKGKVKFLKINYFSFKNKY